MVEQHGQEDVRHRRKVHEQHRDQDPVDGGDREHQQDQEDLRQHDGE